MSTIGQNATNKSESLVEDPVSAMIDELTAANKILLHFGIVDAFGHVSARHPTEPDQFLMSRRVAPGLVQRGDIRAHGLDGKLIVDDNSPLFLERFIHSAIYASRPEIHGVVHSHSPGTVSFSVVPESPLMAVCHTSGFLGAGAPIFDLRDSAGPATDLMIRNNEQGEALCESLGDNCVVLMRGHGATAVGQSLQQAVYHAVYTETNARVQASAMALGTVSYLSPGEAAATTAMSPHAIERTWAFWKSEVANS